MKRLAMAATLVAMVMAAGCESTQELRGVVVEGREPRVYIVSDNDPRLERDPIENARVEVILNPKDIRPKTVSAPPTFSDGQFRLNVEALGAGFLEHELAIHCMAPGYATVWEVMDFPGSGKALLITMPPGRSVPDARRGEDLEEMLKYGQAFD